jgi:hypothetical protein
MTVWTAYQGVEVVESDPIVKYRHPRLGADQDPARLASLEGATLLLLADDIFLVVCNEDGCGFNGITGKEQYVKPEGEQRPIVEQASSLFSHINGAHRSKGPRKSPTKPVVAIERSSRYNSAVIKVAIKIWLKWKATGIREWTQSACDELERLGFTPSFAEKWNPDQLGSLVRQYMKRDQYKNIKAAPMDNADREAIAAMIRETVAREGKGGNHVADNVRITVRKPPHTHTPVDFAQIIASGKGAAPMGQQEEDTNVITGDGPNPTLSFVGSGADQLPIKTMVIDKELPKKPIASVLVTPTPSPVEVAKSNFQFIVELEDGTPMFKYKDELMVGKKVMGVEI